MAKRHSAFRDSNLYPDHPVILGPGIATSQADSRFWYVNQDGLFLKDIDPASSALPMIECLVRVSEKMNFTSSKFEGLSSEQVSSLLNWEAEKYRQKLTVT